MACARLLFKSSILLCTGTDAFESLILRKYPLFVFRCDLYVTANDRAGRTNYQTTGTGYGAFTGHNHRVCYCTPGIRCIQVKG